MSKRLRIKRQQESPEVSEEYRQGYRDGRAIQQEDADILMTTSLYVGTYYTLQAVLAHIAAILRSGVQTSAFNAFVEHMRSQDPIVEKEMNDCLKEMPEEWKQELLSRIEDVKNRQNR